LAEPEREEELLQSVALQNASSILRARQRAEQQLVEAQEELHKTNKRMTRILESVTDGFVAVDSAWRFTYLNPKAEEILRPTHPAGEPLLGRELWAAFPGLDDSDFGRAYRQAVANQETKELEGFYPSLAMWLDVRAYPTGDGLAIYFQDVTRRKEAELRLASERTVLELIATGAPMREVLERVVRDAQVQSRPGTKVAVMLLDDSGERLEHAAAPGLAPDLRAALDGSAVAPGSVTFATAAHEKRAVATRDIAADPGWARYAVLAASHSLKASFALPILSSQGVVLGSLAMYFDENCEPGPRERHAMELAAHLGAIVIERLAATRSLRASQDQLLDMANLIPQLAWMAQPDGEITWYNQGWYEYTGTTIEQMRGGGRDLVHDPGHLPAVLEMWRESISKGVPFEMEFPLRGADGVFRWFLTRANPMRDAAGRVIRWFGTNTNIDQVKRIRGELEEQKRTLEILNRTGAILASSLDLQALVQSATDAATTITGAKFGAFFYNVIGDDGEAFMLYTLSGAPREAFEKFGQPRATALFGPTFRNEGPIRVDDVLADPRYGQSGPHHGMPPGHLPVRSYLAVPVVSRSGEVIGGLFFGHPDVGVFTEPSEQLVKGIASQAAMAIDNARLYEASVKAGKEREMLLESERHARGAAERASRMKDEFLATLSHELRTPLSSILGWSQLLRMRPPDPAELRKGLETIERNARMQTQLIEDLLDMSRITSGKVRLDVQPVQPSAFLEAALETVRPAAEAKGVRLEQVVDPRAGPVSGDPSRLQQVMWNLLNNAIKFTPKGGKVLATVSRVNSHIELGVTDTGQGIEPEFLAHVFERFRQSDSSSTRQHGGLGLGLAIVKHLVELHGGSIRVDSAGLGKGATFTVQLPLAGVRRQEGRNDHPGTAAPAAVDLKTIDLSGIKVLVVDDQPDARELIARVLLECRAEVFVADCALEALRLLQLERPDVLVSDIGMPDVDGYELLRRVRALGAEQGGRTPAIALTAFARSEDRTRALQHGFQVHVSKPVEPSELIVTVASVAGRAGSL
jgi:PAS domain S-box-containing protein